MSKDELKSKHNKLVSKLYDSQVSYQIAQSLIDEAGSESVSHWKSHSVTHALKASLVGDLSSIVTTILGGGYNVEHSVDATAQRIAEAQGKAAALQDVIRYIEDMKVSDD
jgi:hypothetical protein